MFPRPDQWTRRAFLAFALMILCWCAVEATAHDLVLGHSTAVSHLDPHFSAPAAHPHLYNLYDTLVARDQQLDLVPGLATAWRLLDDLTWQFQLRRGVVFHDGTPLTAEDVQFSLQRAASEHPRSPVFDLFHGISRVEILDAERINVVTTSPDPHLPARLATPGGMILPRQYFEEVGMERFGRQPIGTGPLRLTAWLDDATLLFEANRRYWRAPIPFGTVILRAYPEATSRVAALLSGAADLITDVPPDLVGMIDQSGVARVASAPIPGYDVALMNVHRPPLDQKPIRQALQLAVDRQALVRQLWHGHTSPPRGMSSELLGRRTEGNPSLLGFDPHRARELLNKLGYQGEEILLEAAVGSPAYAQPLAESVNAMFQRVGLNARVRRLEPSELVEKLRRRTLQGLLLRTLTSPLFDPDDVWWRAMQPGGLFDYWHHGTWDALMREAQTLHDQVRQRERYRQAAEIFWEEVPVLVLLQPQEIFGIRQGLRWRARGDGVVMASDISPDESAPRD